MGGDTSSPTGYPPTHYSRSPPAVSLSRLVISVGRGALSGGANTSSHPGAFGYLARPRRRHGKERGLLPNGGLASGMPKGRVHSRFSREGNISDGQCVWHGSQTDRPRKQEPSDPRRRRRFCGPRRYRIGTLICNPPPFLVGDCGQRQKNHLAERLPCLQVFENSDNCRTLNPGGRALEGVRPRRLATLSWKSYFRTASPRGLRRRKFNSTGAN
jgi:hypothetical protein